MNSPVEPLNTNSASSETAPGSLPPEPDDSMQEYYQLQRNLLVVTLVATGIIFVSAWVFYSLNIALNYLIGACTGVIYLKMLAKRVEQLGRQKKKMGSARLALFIGVIVAASQIDDLHIIPVFLGFLTYKAALIVYILWTTFASDLD